MKSIRWFYRHRGLLASPPLVLAAFCTYRETENPWLTWPLGIGLLLLGVFIRLWAQQHLHYRLEIRKTLTETGPYRLLRNPIYIGNTLMCLGGVAASELLWLMPLTLLWCAVVYSLVVRDEETHLLEKYGQPYQDFLDRVPRWFPRALHPSEAGLVNRHFAKSLVSELHCLLVLLPFVAKEIVSQLA